MEKKKLLFIFNPKAGKGQIRTKLYDIIDIFVKGGYEVITHPTQGVQDGYQKTKELAGEVDLVVCSGGDGTLDEVVTGLMEAEVQVPLGYIPAGSTNDFANSLKIPLKPVAAVKSILKNEPTLIDVGKFNDRYFSYIASFGIFTASSYSASQAVKNVFGHLTYVFEAVKDLSNITKYHIKATVDDKELEDDYIFGAISNSTAVGGVVKLKDGVVDLSDGEFEVTFVRNPANLAEFNKIVTAITSSKLEGCDMIDFVRGSKVTIESDTPISWSLDGEFADGGTHTEIENLHLACKLRK